MEALREHLLRIVLDWPEFLGVAATGAGARPAMGLARRLACALFGGADPFSLGARAVPDVELAAEVIADAEEILVQIVFGEPLAHWLDRRGEAGLCEWTRDTDTPASALVAHVLASGLTAAPTPLRRPCAADLPGLLKTWLASNCGPLGDGISNVHALSETTPLSRRAGHPLVACLGSGGLAARLVARLVELASLPGELRRLVRNCGPVAERFALEGTSGGGAGIAAVEAARGRLLHAVRIADAKVAAWAILPPTRVNFATDGIAARCLAAMPEAPDGDRLDLARLYVNAIDPCVACDVRIH
ncbi:MAG: nickel-dependent hydrogenase large subunit [Rhodobiaceae bacterium]|nr:nickel-dependent hydrogenase large subunit [Rhodobiaceae bacterium]